MPPFIDEKRGAPEEPGAPRAGAVRQADAECARSVRKRNAAVFSCIALAWLLLDFATKAHFNAFAPGELVAGPYLGLVDFRLVHNTGAAWGLLGDATFALGVLAIAVCALIVAYLFAIEPTSSLCAAVGLALVFAGGVGNAVDRFTLGYVVDFIEPVFIDFPVFNVADIGVTCGVVLFVVALLLGSRRRSADDPTAAGQAL